MLSVVAVVRTEWRLYQCVVAVVWTEWRVYQCVVSCSCGVDRVEGVSVCCLL